MAPAAGDSTAGERQAQGGQAPGAAALPPTATTTPSAATTTDVAVDFSSPGGMGYRGSRLSVPGNDTQRTLSGSQQSSPFFDLSKAATLKRLRSGVVARLREMDLDNDGRISAVELEHAVEDLLREERSHRRYKTVSLAVLAALAFILLANMGLVYAVVMLSKEVVVKGNVMYAKDTDKVIEVDTAKFKVDGRAFRSRGADDDGLPLETVIATTLEEVSTAYSDDFLASVQAIRLSWPGAGSASLRVHGFARPATPESSISILTMAGYVTIHDSGTITVDTNVEAFLRTTGIFHRSNGTEIIPGPQSGMRRMLLQTNGTFEPVETFAQYEAHMTRVCEITASIGVTSQEEFDAKYEKCWKRKMETAYRKRSSFIDGGGIPVPDGFN